jgi:hypothetical protein
MVDPVVDVVDSGTHQSSVDDSHVDDRECTEYEAG